MAPPPIPRDVAAILAPLPEKVRSRLTELRALIFATAAETPQIGKLTETLKWRDPAYLPVTPRIGTTVRMNALKGSERGFALYVPCSTTLLADYRGLYPGLFTFEGDRALHFDVAQKLPVRALKHCIALALTYHARQLS